jgi:hypothetical protein
VDPDRVAIWRDSGDAERVFLDAATDVRLGAVIAYNPTFGAQIRATAPSSEVFRAIEQVVACDRLPAELAVEHGPTSIVSPDPDADCMSPWP